MTKLRITFQVQSITAHRDRA